MYIIILACLKQRVLHLHSWHICSSCQVPLYQCRPKSASRTLMDVHHKINLKTKYEQTNNTFPNKYYGNICLNIRSRCYVRNIAWFHETWFLNSYRTLIDPNPRLLLPCRWAPASLSSRLHLLFQSDGGDAVPTKRERLPEGRGGQQPVSFDYFHPEAPQVWWWEFPTCTMLNLKRKWTLWTYGL